MYLFMHIVPQVQGCSIQYKFILKIIDNKPYSDTPGGYQKKTSRRRLLYQGEYFDQTFNVKRLISVTLRSLSTLPRY